MKNKKTAFDKSPQGRWDAIEQRYAEKQKRRSYHFKPLGATKKKRRKKK